MKEYKDYVNFEITKENAKDLYIELNGMFSPFLHMLQYENKDFYNSNPNNIDSISEGDFIKKALASYSDYLDYEAKLMEKYRNSDSKYNILGKFFRLGFTNDDFLKWNSQLLNQKIDKYYERKKEIKIEEIPYCDKYYNTRFIDLIDACNIYTNDYNANKRLLEALKDYITIDDGIIYRYYNHWIHNSNPTKDDSHPFNEIDESLLGKRGISMLNKDDVKVDPFSLGYYFENHTNSDLVFRFKILGYQDLLNEFDEILNLRKKYIGPLLIVWTLEDEAMDLLDIYKLAFTEKSILCPYYGLTSYEMKEKLGFINHLYNYFIEYNGKQIGAITYYNEYEKNSHYCDTYIKCLCLIPEYQNQGIGTKIIDFIFNSFIFSKNIYIDIHRDNNKLLNFFVDICKMDVLKEYEDNGIKILTLIKKLK